VDIFGGFSPRVHIRGEVSPNSTHNYPFITIPGGGYSYSIHVTNMKEHDTHIEYINENGGFSIFDYSYISNRSILFRSLSFLLGKTEYF